MELHVRKKTEGFTLTELLTVIGIVGILALIVFAVVGRLRENANAAKCVANLRQLGVLFNQNLAEMNYKIPYYAIDGSIDYTWLNYLDKSTLSEPPSAKVAVCPSVLPKGYRDIYSIYGIDIAGGGGTNTRSIFPTPTGEGVMSANVVTFNPLLMANLSRRVLLADSMVRSKSAWNANSQVGFVPISCSPSDAEGLVHFRHTGGKANFLFFDGHVEAMNFADLKALVAKEYGYTGSLGYIDSQGNEFIK